LYGIYALVVFVSEILLVRCAHSFDFWYVNNSCVNTVRQHFPWSILYVLKRHSQCIIQRVSYFFFEEIAVHLCYWKTDKTSCQLSLLCVPLYITYLKLIQLILKPYFAINSNHTDSVANLVLISFAINVMSFYTFCPYTNTRFLPVGLFILARVGFSTISFVIIRHILCHPLCPISSNVRKALELNGAFGVCRRVSMLVFSHYLEVTKLAGNKISDPINFIFSYFC